MTNQKHLTYLTNLVINELNSPKIRAVKAIWKNEINTAYITFYFDGNISEEELEEASIACTEIIAQFSNGFLQEKYILWDYPKPLPDDFLAYRRPENIS